VGGKDVGTSTSEAPFAAGVASRYVGQSAAAELDDSWARLDGLADLTAEPQRPRGEGRGCVLLFEPADGGVPEHVLQLALGLRERGWAPHVIAPEGCSVERDLSESGLPLTRLRLRTGYGPPREDAAALARIVAVLRRERPQLLHAHSAKGGVLGRLAGRIARVPVVYTPHCYPFVGDLPGRKRAAALAIERALGRLAKATICVAEEERRLARRLRLTPAGRLHLVRNGAPVPPPVEADPELSELAAQGPLAVCVSVLRPQKSVDLFVRAAAIVDRLMPEARLAVVGNGEERDELVALAKALGVSERLRFVPFKAPAARSLAAADLFVLSSAWEGLPISILEAQACGVPQVATDVGGTSEALAHGETGLMVPPGDPEAMAHAIVTILRDPELRARMSAASRRRQARLFGLQRMVDATAEVYTHVVGAPAVVAEQR
jgi:glycosyltransferase involved in cell wall biosynthesis